MSQSDYGDLICFEKLNRADQDEMVMVVYECVDAVRGRDPNTETEDTNTKRILRTAFIVVWEPVTAVGSLRRQMEGKQEMQVTPVRSREPSQCLPGLKT
ncbi:hypothetical protein SRHO_G00250250 [Serrasalmus rhombeus]